MKPIHPANRKRPSPLPLLASLLLLYGISALGAGDNTQGDATQESTPEILPSQELLLFLAEFDNVDDETFSLLVTRSEKDIAEQHSQERNKLQEKTRAKRERGDNNE